MADIFVSVHGDDAHEGSERHPVQTLPRAQALARERLKSHPKVVVEIGGGTYCLRYPLVISRVDSGTTYRGKAGEEVVFSGATQLEAHWRPYRDGIWCMDMPRIVDMDGLFIDGEPQILARYPKFDPNVAIFNGFAADAISPERVARWKDPAGGYFHAMHVDRWGSFHYAITGKDDEGNLTMEGGWQNNRRNGIHPEQRFVEGIFEELDTPGEWFFDRNQRILYYYPCDAGRLAEAKVEVAQHSTLIFLNGSHTHEIRDIHLQGLTFRHTARTFMQNKHPLLRSDWTTAHDGALKLDGTSDCTFTDLSFEHLGGNAMFLHAWNKRIAIRSCHFREIGANGIAFVGSPASVRNPLYDVDHHQSFDTIDKTPGPKHNFYPSDCLVEDCLITRTGRIEKQSAPIQISMARRITVRHCSIYDVPRAGINIGDGCWGGHVIEFCDIFDTVKETGDHGSFNSWGRDRYWQLSDKDANQLSGPELEKIPFLDAVEPITLRNNRWRCDHGWDIDLDDGSTNFVIENNLCLHGGIKNREGFGRIVQNNVIVGDSFHPHVWFHGSGDIVRHNIVMTPYHPIGMNKPWGKEVDHNFLHEPGHPTAHAEVLAEQSGRDENSLIGDAKFIDPDRGDYRVAPDSPALGVGFKNFPMDRFGVTSPKLKAVSRSPSFQKY